LGGPVQAAAETVQVLVEPARGDVGGGCVEDRAGVLEDRGRVLIVAVVRESRLQGVPVGVAACGGGFADAGRAVADADVALVVHGVSANSQKRRCSLVIRNSAQGAVAWRSTPAYFSR
jgi:hypothetical protein